MNLFELAAKISLDSADFNKGIADAENSGKGLGESLEGVFGKIKSALKTIVAGVAIKKGISLVKQLASETAEAGDRIDKQSQILGLSRRAYQEWDYILGQNGISIDNLAASMKQLNSVIQGAADGSEEYNGALVRLGLNFVELQDMNPEDQFEAVVRAFQQMPAGAQKSALAVKIFGRQGMQLLPLLNSESTSIDELRQKAQELGLIMSDDAIDASVAYGDAMDDLQRTFNGLKYSIGAKLLPVFTNAVQKVTNYAGKLSTAFQENGLQGVFDVLRTDLGNFISQLKASDNPVLQKVGEALEKIKEAGEFIYSLFTDFDGTVAKLQSSDKPVLQLLGGALNGIKEAVGFIGRLFRDFDGTVAELQSSDKPVLKLLGNALNGIKVAISFIGDLFTDFDGKVKELQDSDQPVLQLLGEALAFVKGGLEGIIKIINGDWKGAMESFRNSDSFILQTIGEIETSFDVAGQRIRDFTDDVKEALGMSGAHGQLYATWVQNMGNEMENITDEAGFEEWLEKLKKGLTDAEFTAEDIQAIIEKIRSNGWGDWASQSGTTSELLQLAGVNNPYGNESLIQMWKDRLEAQKLPQVGGMSQTQKEQVMADAALEGLGLAEQFAEEHPIIAPLAPQTDEEKLEETRRWTQEQLDSNPLSWEVDLVPTGIHSVLQQQEGFEAPTFFSNAKGQWDVPFDNYLTTLHRDEMVLSASRARAYREGEDTGGSGVHVASLIADLKESIRGALENVTVRSYLNGRDVTQEVNRETIKQLKARRFAT